MSSHKKYASAYLAIAMMLTMMADIFLDGCARALVAIVSMVMAALFVIYITDPDNK